MQGQVWLLTLDALSNLRPFGTRLSTGSSLERSDVPRPREVLPADHSETS
jgi:hypothetical protein